MAEATMGGNASARKFPRTAFDSSVTSSPSAMAKANPPALPADLTAAIIRLVKEATSSAMHPAAAAAEGTSTDPAAGPKNWAANPTAAPAIPPAPPLRSITVDALEPVIVLANREERAELGRHPQLQTPGFYAGLWSQSRTAYAGMGENVGGRAGTNPELGGATPAEHVVCIADRHGRLTARQALVGERLMGQMLQQPGGFSLRNRLPAGAPVDPAEYDTVRLFVARACLALRAAGVLFTRLPAAALLLPPAKAPAFRPLQPDTPIYRLAVPSLRSHLAEEDGEWRLLAGSEIRVEVQPSAFGPALMARAELLHCGGLLRTGKMLSTTRDLYFSSAWAAAHFVLGQKPRSDVWKLIPSAADARGPRA
jgi:hypothetical protein